MTQAPSWLRTGAGPAALSGATPVHSPDAGFRVLFVCTGNICRSAFAESYLRSRLGTDGTVTVSSAGTMAVVGHGMEAEMAARAQLLGIPHVGHSARQLTGRLLGGVDLVLVFAEHHLAWVLDERPDVFPRTVALGQAAAALDALPAGTRVTWEDLAAEVRSVRPDPLPGDWIADPYGRGPAAAEDTSARIVEDIDRILDRVTPSPWAP